MKKKGKLIAAAAVMVLAVVFCVSYTHWPRSWNAISGDREWQISSSYLLISTVDHGKSGFDQWTMNTSDLTASIESAVFSTLNSGTYRASLRNLINKTMFKTSSWSGDGGEICLWLMRQSEEMSVYIYGSGNIVIPRRNGQEYLTIYQTDPGVYEQLKEVLQTHGTFRDE